MYLHSRIAFSSESVCPGSVSVSVQSITGEATSPREFTIASIPSRRRNASTLTSSPSESSKTPAVGQPRHCVVTNWIAVNPCS
jgi:hypothetical protein